MKIDIQIDDEKNFMDVALVVDQPEFLKLINGLRKKYKVSKTWSYKEYQDYYRKIRDTKKSEELKKDIEKTRDDLNLPSSFIRTITMSLFCGVVTDKDYLPAFLTRYKQSSNTDGYDEYCIVLSPQARDLDVTRALQEYRDQVKNYLGHNLKDYKFIPTSINGLVNGKQSVKKHRSWYLNFNSGMSLEKIEEKCINKCPLKKSQPNHITGKNKPKECCCFDESTIRKGIQNYESLLWKSRTL